MTCTACEQASVNPHCGSYHLDCVSCCARLVFSARLCEKQQRIMFNTIARFPRAPTREEIIECIKKNYPDFVKDEFKKSVTS